MGLKKTGILLVLMLNATVLLAQQEAITGEGFSVINLNYPGLQNVRQLVTAKQYNEAAAALLRYYQQKNKDKEPDFSNAEKPVDGHAPIDNTTRETAERALQHQFQPHKGYGFFDYGKDINWQLWPVKDNEVRWQLHRVKWWQAMALVYGQTKDERYAKEWMTQFSDWAQKNPLGLSADNDQYAWRPLEVSDRIQSLAPTFGLFINANSFTPAFLMQFLKSYHQEADYLPEHYAKEGNHRLFEAQRVLFAGASFPEFNDAARWRKSGIEVLNTEIAKQVYNDGVQYELSPAYHVASIDIFLKAYRAAQLAHIENEFPASYKQTIENMIMALISFTYPDYNTPMFGDSWLINKKARLKQFAEWSEVFLQNKTIQYFATDGKSGKAPDFLSKGLTTAGFYTFRNGWDSNATVMVLKASPPGEFHAQPDNGTFELWVKGRNFMPDAGVFVYSGDEEINKLREEYRQTKMHNTLTLNDQNMVITKAKADKWVTGKNMDVLTYTNPSYPDLNQQRSVLFIDQQYFLVIDNAIGKATGKLDVRFHLKEDAKPIYNTDKKRAYTTYADGNNLLIESLNIDEVVLVEEQSKVSYEYRKEQPRPAVAFEKQKTDDKTQNFISIIYPFSSATAPQISLKENAGNDYTTGKLNISLTIDGKQKNIVTQLFP